MSSNQSIYKRILCVTVALGLSLTAIAVRAAPSSDLWPVWQASDESNLEKINHTGWQQTLDGYLQTDHPSGINRFKYKELADSKEDKKIFLEYINYMEGLDPRKFNKAEQHAYWINLYNALTVKLIIEKYPVDSITDIHESFFGFGPWDDKYSKVAGKTLTLNDIEHRILRPIWNDARVHYVVNCASIGCPNLLPTAFTGENVEELLDVAAVQYVNHPRGVDVKGDEIVLSKIYDWYIIDFGNNQAKLFEHLQQYAKPDLKEKLVNFSGDVEYFYDWGLNQP